MNSMLDWMEKQTFILECQFVKVGSRDNSLFNVSHVFVDARNEKISMLLLFSVSIGISSSILFLSRLCMVMVFNA